MLQLCQQYLIDTDIFIQLSNVLATCSIGLIQKRIQSENTLYGEARQEYDEGIQQCKKSKLQFLNFLHR